MLEIEFQDTISTQSYLTSRFGFDGRYILCVPTVHVVLCCKQCRNLLAKKKKNKANHKITHTTMLIKKSRQTKTNDICIDNIEQWVKKALNSCKNYRARKTYSSAEKSCSIIQKPFIFIFNCFFFFINLHIL